jgi:uncharacterized membrane protein HdeD (DUF308 family)
MICDEEAATMTQVPGKEKHPRLLAFFIIEAGCLLAFGLTFLLSLALGREATDSLVTAIGLFVLVNVIGWMPLIRSRRKRRA